MPHRTPDTDAWMTSGEGHPRRWAILAALVVSLLVVVLDNTVLNIALPTIQRDLNTTQGELVWAVDSYILVFAALLFTWGVLGDRVGRRKVLLIGLVIFVVASTIAAFSVNVQMLIAMRAIMGIGGAAIMPVTLAIITVVFPPHERGRAIGMWAGAVGGAIALGPVLGGLLLQHPEWSSWLTGNDWGSVFLINLPIVLIGIGGIVKNVPETKDPNAKRLDIPGLLISFVGLVSLVYGIIHASDVHSWTEPLVVWPIVAGALLIALFILMEARSDHASFDVSLFKNRGYAVALTATSLAFFAMSGITFTLPFYLQVLRGYDTLQAGLAFIPFALGQFISAPRSAAMVTRFGNRKVMTTGLVIVAISLFLLTRIEIETPLWYALLLFFLFGLGMGNVIAPGTAVLQNVLPLARAGAGSAVQNTVRQVAGALGVAIISTFLATQYAKNIAPVLDALPAQFPDAAKDVASGSVLQTVGVLTQAQQQGLPADIAANAQHGAFEAYMQSMHFANTISLVVIVVSAVVVATLLPPITTPARGDRAVGAPKSGTAALVQEQAEHYAEELAQEIVPPHRDSDSGSDDSSSDGGQAKS